MLFIAVIQVLKYLRLKPIDLAAQLVDTVAAAYASALGTENISPLIAELFQLADQHKFSAPQDLIAFIIRWLGEKWEKGLVVMGNFSTKATKSNVTRYSLVLPDFPSSPS